VDGPSPLLEEGYLHQDHLGSLDRVTAVTGSAAQASSFDAFGKRRHATTWANDNTDALFAETQWLERGYTGHQQLDGVRLIHMNGRVQNPVWGRMLSPDPVVGDLSRPQSLNAYSYVMNNPLSFTDPTGFEPDYPRGECPPDADCTWHPSQEQLDWLRDNINLSNQLNRWEAIGAKILNRYGNIDNRAVARKSSEVFNKTTDFLFGDLIQGAACVFDGGCKSQEQIHAAATWVLAAATLGTGPVAMEAGESILVIGRGFDTAIAKDWAGHTVIDLPAAEWSLATNDTMIKAAIDARQTIYLASSTTAKNMFNVVENRATVFGREVQQFLEAGYQRIGDYLYPPGVP
jgi:RHS repeat-associated protein